MQVRGPARTAVSRAVLPAIWAAAAASRASLSGQHVPGVDRGSGTVSGPELARARTCAGSSPVLGGPQPAYLGLRQVAGRLRRGGG